MLSDSYSGTPAELSYELVKNMIGPMGNKGSVTLDATFFKNAISRGFTDLVLRSDVKNYKFLIDKNADGDVYEKSEDMLYWNDHAYWYTTGPYTWTPRDSAVEEFRQCPSGYAITFIYYSISYIRDACFDVSALYFTIDNPGTSDDREWESPWEGNGAVLDQTLTVNATSPVLEIPVEDLASVNTLMVSSVFSIADKVIFGSGTSEYRAPITATGQAVSNAGQWSAGPLPMNGSATMLQPMAVTRQADAFTANVARKVLLYNYPAKKWDSVADIGWIGPGDIVPTITRATSGQYLLQLALDVHGLGLDDVSSVSSFESTYITNRSPLRVKLVDATGFAISHKDGSDTSFDSTPTLGFNPHYASKHTAVEIVRTFTWQEVEVREVARSDNFGLSFTQDIAADVPSTFFTTWDAACDDLVAIQFRARVVPSIGFFDYWHPASAAIPTSDPAILGGTRVQLQVFLYDWLAPAGTDPWIRQSPGCLQGSAGQEMSLAEFLANHAHVQFANNTIGINGSTHLTRHVHDGTSLRDLRIMFRFAFKFNYTAGRDAYVAGNGLSTLTSGNTTTLVHLAKRLGLAIAITAPVANESAMCVMGFEVPANREKNISATSPGESAVHVRYEPSPVFGTQGLVINEIVRTGASRVMVELANFGPAFDAHGWRVAITRPVQGFAIPQTATIPLNASAVHVAAGEVMVVDLGDVGVTDLNQVGVALLDADGRAIDWFEGPSYAGDTPVPWTGGSTTYGLFAARCTDDDTGSLADAAVLRSFNSVEFNPGKCNVSTVLFEQTLIQSKIPFAIIFD
ncbi:MAG: hypothetical protein Q6365_019050, partial [Candidatus Sigynarchaeota archaeon]